MNKTLTLTGLLVPALLLMAGCDAQPTQARVAAPAAPTNLSRAFNSGRLEIVPEGLSVTQAQASASIINARTEALVGPKGADPWLRPQGNYQDEGLRQLELTSAEAPSAGWELELELPKAEFDLGEPIFARATLTNISGRTMKVAPQLDPQYTYGHFVVETPSGETLGLKPLAIACSRGDIQVEEVAAGDSRSEDFPVYFGSQGNLFTEPGTYKVQLLYRGITEDSGRVDSNPLYVTVRAGTEALEDAAALAMDGEAGLFMMWGEGDHLRRGISNLELLMDLYPDSPIVDDARFALGRNFSVDFMDYSTEQLREARPEAARRYLEPLVQNILSGEATLDRGRARDAFVFLSQAYRGLGEPAAARAVLNSYLDTFGAEASAEDVVKVRDALAL